MNDGMLVGSVVTLFLTQWTWLWYKFGRMEQKICDINERLGRLEGRAT